MKVASKQQLGIDSVPFPGSFKPRYYTISQSEGSGWYHAVHEALPVLKNGHWVSAHAIFEIGIEERSSGGPTLPSFGELPTDPAIFVIDPPTGLITCVVCGLDNVYLIPEIPGTPVLMARADINLGIGVCNRPECQYKIAKWDSGDKSFEYRE